MIELSLPMPPSANRLWRRAGHVMHKSTEYKSWLMQAGLIARSQYKGEPITGPYSLSMDVTRMNKRRSDLDNKIKPTNDLLVSIGFIRDDSDCASLTARWVGTGEGIFVRVQAA